MSLATLDRWKQDLGINDTVDDTKMQSWLDRATGLCERAAGRPLVQASYVEYVDGDGSRFLNLRQGPIVSVTAVHLVTWPGGAVDTQDGSNWTAGGTLDEGWRMAGHIESYISTWLTGSKNYKVTYDAGYNDTTGAANNVPADVVDTCIYAATWLRDRDQLKAAGRASVDIGDGVVVPRDDEELTRDLRRRFANYRTRRG